MTAVRVEHLAEGVTLYCGDMLTALPMLAENSVDSCVCDPPYHLTSIVKRFSNAKVETEQFAASNPTRVYKSLSRGFMGKQWDGGDIAFRPETWAEVYRVLKPGAHLVAFGGTRSYHRMACAIEDAGFEIRDSLMWIYGSGFPKSHDVSKGIDKAAGVEREVLGQRKDGRYANPMAVSGRSAGIMGEVVERQAPDLTRPATNAAREWEGWGTALKPSHEPIVLARKPLSEKTIATNVLRWGTGALNIDGCRVEAGDGANRARPPRTPNEILGGGKGTNLTASPHNANGRWPANVLHDGSEEVVGAFPTVNGVVGALHDPNGSLGYHGGASGAYRRGTPDFGSAARFFYQVKQDDPCHSINFATDAEQRSDLKSERVVSALKNAVALSTPRLVLQSQSYRAPNMSVSERELKIACESVIEAILNLERRSWLGLEQESITVRLGPAICVATQKPTGITTITISLWRSARSVEAVTFNIIETNAEAGGLVSGKRLFYTAKADADDRIGSKHPTIKPVDLKAYLARLITPPGGTVLDPFAGTGTTGEAALREGMRAILVEREAEYQADIRRRISLVFSGPDERRRESLKAAGKTDAPESLPLFGGAA